MQAIGVLLGLVGLVLLLVSPAAGCLVLILGGLFVAVGANGQKRQQEQQRHEELMIAMQSKQPAVNVSLPANSAANDDPFATSAAATLDTASGLIRSKRYSEARTLLQTISNEPKAQEWLTRLDDPRYK